MTGERMRELRHKMWSLARLALTTSADDRSAMPDLLDEEYAYAREFLRGIARRTRPGEYCEKDDDEVEVDEPLDDEGAG